MSMSIGNQLGVVAILLALVVIAICGLIHQSRGRAAKIRSQPDLFMGALRDGSEATLRRVSEILGKDPICNCGATFDSYLEHCIDVEPRICKGTRSIEAANIQAQREKWWPTR